MEVTTLKVQKGDVVFVGIDHTNGAFGSGNGLHTEIRNDIKDALKEASDLTGVKFCLVPNLKNIKSVEIGDVVTYETKDTIVGDIDIKRQLKCDCEDDESCEECDEMEG